MDDPTDLRIGLLGAFTASAAGTALALGGPRQRAVLAVLVLARGAVVPVETLVQAVWGDDPPADDVGALQAYVSHLRRRLQPGSAARARSAVIVREGRGYAVRLPPDAVDAWRFEALVQEAAATEDPTAVAALLDRALGLWRGPALAGYRDEPWAAAEIGRLGELRALARERLLDARLRLGEAALLVPDLEAMVAEEPLREERWRLLALALYRAHRQADALAALRRARATLGDELGVDPGPALRELEEQVLAQAPALELPRPRSPAREAPLPGAGHGLEAVGPEPVAAPAQPPKDLLDRGAETAALRRALDDLAAGEPRVLLIEGPAGIGKTRLLTEARRLAAERSVRVLTARGSQLERAFGFGVVRQLFEPELADPERRAALLSGAAAGARGVFDLAGSPSEGSFAVLHGLYWLTVDLAASGPLLLAVDDVQWCDPASLRWLAYLVRRLDAIPVLVVGTVRTGEPHDEEELLGELALEPATVLVQPAPLSVQATAAFVARRLGEPVSPLFVQACHRTTAGNPLLLRQLVRALEADRVRPDASHADRVVAVGSRAVSSLVLMRLRRLGGSVPAVARAAAVLGDGAPLPVIAAVADLPERETAAALAVLARAEVVKDEQPPTFVHPLVREAVHRDLPAAERALHHERAARVLRAAGADDEQVAAHLLLAPGRTDDGTVAVLRRAARTAADRGATATAVALLRRALAEPPGTDDRRGAVLLELGRLEALLDGAAGTEHLLQGYAATTDPGERAAIAITVARTSVFAAPPGVATAFAREAATVLPPELADQRQALLAIERISGFMHRLEPEVWRTPAPPEPAGDGDGARMLAATLAFETTVDGADRERAVGLARRALDGDRLWHVDDGLFWVVAASVRMLADDDLGDFWDRARAQAHRRGSLFAAMSASVWQGFWHWRRGELDEALACFVVALEQDRLWGGSGVGEAYTRAFEIGCRLDRGDLPAARGAADAALARPVTGEGARLLHHAVARLLAAEGRPVEALATLDAAAGRLPVLNPVWNPWRSIAARALHGLGRTDEAVALVEDEVRRLRAWGAPTWLGPALRTLGVLAGRDGLPWLREAVEVLEPTTAAVELARARCSLGARPELPAAEAVPLLQAATDAAHALGARGVRQRAWAALERRGVPAGARTDPPRRVTATERRVRELAATGLDAREIAQRLFLAPGTVHALLDGAGDGRADETAGSGLKFFSSPATDAVGHR